MFSHPPYENLLVGEKNVSRYSLWRQKSSRCK
jgi:hypothetical protein